MLAMRSVGCPYFCNGEWNNRAIRGAGCLLLPLLLRGIIRGLWRSSSQLDDFIGCALALGSVLSSFARLFVHSHYRIIDSCATANDFCSVYGTMNDPAQNRTCYSGSKFDPGAPDLFASSMGICLELWAEDATPWPDRIVSLADPHDNSGRLFGVTKDGKVVTQYLLVIICSCPACRFMPLTVQLENVSVFFWKFYQFLLPERCAFPLQNDRSLLSGAN